MNCILCNQPLKQKQKFYFCNFNSTEHWSYLRINNLGEIIEKYIRLNVLNKMTVIMINPVSKSYQINYPYSENNNIFYYFSL